MTSLKEETFDPMTHASMKAFDEIISEQPSVDNISSEDVQFEKVSSNYSHSVMCYMLYRYKYL